MEMLGPPGASVKGCRSADDAGRTVGPRVDGRREPGFGSPASARPSPRRPRRGAAARGTGRPPSRPGSPYDSESAANAPEGDA